MPITVIVSGRSGAASDFIGGLCSERLTFAGDPLTLPAKVALLALDGTTLAAADLRLDEDGALAADLDTDTQEIADLLRFQPTDTLTPATLFVGDDATLQAVIPISLKKNWLDDDASHPPAPLPNYWTKEQIQAAIAAALSAHDADGDAHPHFRQAIAAEQTARKQADDGLAQALTAEQTARAKADEAHAGRADNPHKVTAAQVGALTESAADDRYVRVPPDAETIVLNHLLRGLRFYAHNDAEAGPDGNSPFFVIGSQLSGGQLREDRWVAKLFYNAIEFLRAPGTERVRLEFNRPGAAARATSEAIVLWKEMVAALAEATEGLIGADGGTVGGVLRMKNPKVSADDDTSHDIALVPNANGQGLQVQFPGGSTAMIRMKTGTLATTAEVKDGDASTLASAKAYADGKVSGAYRYKGTVASKEALPASGNVEGDVWNVSEDGMNYAWTGTEWDALGASVDLSAYYTKAEVDEKISSALGDIQAALAAI